jgi:regulatory protein
MPTVSDVQKIDDEPKRRRVVFEDASDIEISYEISLATGLLPGRTVEADIVEDACRRDRLRGAEVEALALLNRKEHSESSLRKRLLKSGHPDHVVTDVLAKCVECGYVDDRRLAEHIVHDGVELKRHGPARLKRTLMERGVGRELADEVLSAARDDQPSQVEQALLALRSKQRTYARLEPEIAKRRMMGFLQRRGFDFGTVKEAARQFAEQLETHD